MKRLCIYVTYDFENIVDDYITYMLKELRKVVECLIVVCNYEFISSGIENIQLYADKIYYRKNIGFDAGAYKDVMCNLVGWEEIHNYDELLLVNDSFFGPFISFESIFAQMEGRKNDFWGLTMHTEARGAFDRKIPEHIQSFFIAIQKRLLLSDDFMNYWENIPYFVSFDEVVFLFEIEFTKYFKERGYSYSVLADNKSNDVLNKENNYCQYSMISFELMKKRNFPFLKRQQLVYNTLYGQTQENLKLSIDYISNHTDYDVNMIWKNIIRTMNISELQHSLHLQYILSDEKIDCNKHHDVVIAVSANYINACEYTIEYLKQFTQIFNVYVYSYNEEILAFYHECGISCIPKSLDTYLEMRNLSRFKYVCIIHDEDMLSNEVPSYVHKSSFYNIWENLLKNTFFVERIISKFDSECKLGFLAPPLPNFGKYFGKFGRGWDGRFSDCKQIINDKKVHCVISQTKPPFVVTENYWVRGQVLEDLERFEDIDFNIMKYLWIFLTQEKGFYSGIIESTEYASINEVNKQYYLNEIGSQIRQHYGDFNDFLEMNVHMSEESLKRFCKRYTRIYVYGTGKVAKKYQDSIPNVEGFIVSDGQPNMGKVGKIPIHYLSEIQFNDEMGVIVCTEKKYQNQIVGMLKDKGVNNYICV